MLDLRSLIAARLCLFHTRLPKAKYLLQTNQNPNQGEQLPQINNSGSWFPFPNRTLSLFPSSPVSLRPTNVSCTPARQNAARVPLHTCSLNANTVTHQTRQNISFKKTFKMQKRWTTFQAVEQVNPTAQNTSRLHRCFVLFIAYGGLTHGKHGKNPWCLC